MVRTVADVVRRRRARGVPGALLVLAALVLAGCGGMPESGQAGPGRQVGEVVPELLVAPAGPRPGAGPAEIVGGFLRAGAASDVDHAVARSFLVGPVVRSWSPSHDVVVFPDDSSLKVTVRGERSPVRVDVRTPVQATIDAQGRYTEAAPGTTAHAVFTVVQTGAGWRVSVLDAAFGSWLPQYELDRTYSALQVAFVASGTHNLVPDVRWFPGPRPGLATALIRQLLLGPPRYLAGAVTTGFPPGTTLAVDAVPTTNGVAQVDLTSQALAATPAMRQMMWAQLASTLRRLPTVADLQLTVAGSAFKVPGVTGTSVYGDTGFRDDVRVSGEPVVLTGDRLAWVDPVSGLLSSEGPRLPQAEGLRAVSVGAQASTVVGLDDAGRRVLRLAPGPRRTVLLTGASWVRPVIDSTGALWEADQARPGRLSVLGSAQLGAAGPPGVPIQLAPAWLARRTVRSVDVSRDGSRVVIVSAGSDGVARADVAGIVRRPDGEPVALAAPREVARSLRQVDDAVWADRTALVVLGRRPADPVSTVYEVVVGGASTALPPVKGAVAVAAGDGLRAVYVITSSGKVLGRSGVGWADVGPGRSVSVSQ